MHNVERSGLQSTANICMVSMKTTSTVRQLRAVKKKRPPKCKTCGLSKHSRKDCPKRTGRGTSSYTPTDVKCDLEHVSDEELTSSGCSGSDVSLDMWCLDDDDLFDVMSDTESKHKKGMVKSKRERV